MKKHGIRKKGKNREKKKNMAPVTLERDSRSVLGASSKRNTGEQKNVRVYIEVTNRVTIPELAFIAANRLHGIPFNSPLLFLIPAVRCVHIFCRFGAAALVAI